MFVSFWNILLKVTSFKNAFTDSVVSVTYLKDKERHTYSFLLKNKNKYKKIKNYIGRGLFPVLFKSQGLSVELQNETLLFV